MALNVVQTEEICQLLQQVPRLVDRLEARRADFADGVTAWLKQVEKTLENNRLPAVSQAAAWRSLMLQAARGVQLREITLAGRPTTRKVIDATASVVLQKCTQLLHEVIAERQTAHQEAERVARQLMAVAEVKGIIDRYRNRGNHQAFLQAVRDAVASDQDLAGGYVHLVSLVGKSDALIFLDRATPQPP
jgi:hypothetical protein